MLTTGAAGCGGEDFANDPRPADEVIVSATIARTKVTVSPAKLGAGPIELRASNQTPSSEEITMRSERLVEGGKRLRQSTGPINPGDTASLKADLDPGTYRVSVTAPAIKPATVTVGASRPSGQNSLLQP